MNWKELKGRVKVISDYWRVEVSCTETRKIKSRFVKEGRKENIVGVRKSIKFEVLVQISRWL